MLTFTEDLVLVPRGTITVIVEWIDHCDIVRIPVRLYAAFAYNLNRGYPQARYWIHTGAPLAALSPCFVDGQYV